MFVCFLFLSVGLFVAEFFSSQVSHSSLSGSSSIQGGPKIPLLLPKCVVIFLKVSFATPGMVMNPYVVKIVTLTFGWIPVIEGGVIPFPNIGSMRRLYICMDGGFLW